MAKRGDRVSPPPRSGDFKGQKLEQWQYEVTGGGRVWYCIDDESHRVLLTLAMTGHPKETD